MVQVYVNNTAVQGQLLLMDPYNGSLAQDSTLTFIGISVY